MEVRLRKGGKDASPETVIPKAKHKINSGKSQTSDSEASPETVVVRPTKQKPATRPTALIPGGVSGQDIQLVEQGRTQSQDKSSGYSSTDYSSSGRGSAERLIALSHQQPLIEDHAV